MPAEAIHLSVYADCLATADIPARFFAGRLWDTGRLGAVLVDMPYFERFPLSILRYLLRRPTAIAPWGDRIHSGTPIALAHALLACARELRAAARETEADDIVALALGLVSHFAVDRALHPWINELAGKRAVRLGTAAAHEHTEIEKFQSVLFHEQRNGFDFMGESALARHIAVDANSALHSLHVRTALQRAFLHAFGQAPESAQWSRWTRGYGQYVALLSSFFGKQLVPEAVKERVRDEVYRGPGLNFAARYEEAVALSQKAVDAAFALSQSLDHEAVFNAILPEGPIDF